MAVVESRVDTFATFESKSIVPLTWKVPPVVMLPYLMPLNRISKEREFHEWYT